MSCKPIELCDQDGAQLLVLSPWFLQLLPLQSHHYLPHTSIIMLKEGHAVDVGVPILEEDLRLCVCH